MDSTEFYERYVSSSNGEPSIIHTGQIEPQILRQLFDKNTNKALSEKERRQLQKEWEALSQTQKVLRVWINEELRGVSENHYDPIIIHTINKLHNEQGTKEFIKAGKVIEEVVKQSDPSVNIYFLEYRIRHLIYSGTFELKGIPKSMRHYSVRIR